MKIWPALLFLPVLGCTPGYAVQVTVTVPTDVQRAFSAQQPGLVMVRWVALARLCDPTDTPLVLHSSFQRTGRCASRTEGEESAYAYRLLPGDLDSLSVHQMQVVSCGQTAPLTDADTVNAISDVAFNHTWASRGGGATGSAGSCDAAGNYVAQITLALGP